jgi:CRISPR-associated endonuclease Csn1
MWRVDFFEKADKYYAVPVYQSDRKRNAAIPNRAVLAYKPRDEWTLMDETYRFCFSLHPNDFIRLDVKGSKYHGYFVGLDVSTAAISILAHDRDATVGKIGVWRGIGVKIGVEFFEKCHVDVLGNVYRAKPEVRSGLA